MEFSKKAIAILDQALENGISVFLDGEQVRFKVSKNTTPDPISVQLLKSNKELIKEFLLNQKEASQEISNQQDTITSYDREDFNRLPLSFSQERLWFIDKFGGTLHYHMPEILVLKGEVDEEILAYAFREIVNRHEVLRTVFQEDDGKAYLTIQPKDKWELSCSEAQRDENLKTFIEAEISKPFDLSKDHMLRAHLIRISDQERILISVFHHIASDGWSESIFVDELIELYAAKTENRSPRLVPLSIQYTDYAIWQRKYFEGQQLDKELAYWEEKLKGISPLNLPLDYPRPAMQSNNGDSLSFTIDQDLKNKLIELAKQEDVTLFMLLVAVFKVLLFKYTHQEDICVGTPTANRTREEVEPLIGYFLNALPLRSNLSDNPSFKAFLSQVKITTVEAFTHQDAPFEKIVDRVEKSRNLSRTPIFQVMFIYQNTPEMPTLKLGEAILSSETLVAFHKVKFDLSLCVNQSSDFLDNPSDTLDIDIQYGTDLFSTETIERIIKHYKLLLSAVVSNPNELVGDLTMLEDKEEKQLLLGFNDTRAQYPKDQTIVELFEKQVKETPDQIAVVFEHTTLSYETLNEYANQLGNYLREKYTIQPDDIIGLSLDRSEWMIIAILGVLKSGGAYLPISPDYPEDRINYMLEDSRCKVLINEVVLQNFAENRALYSSENPSLTTTPKNLAYVIYTSGSTGNPKGVLIEHQNLVNYNSWFVHTFDQETLRSSLMLSSYTFDGVYTSVYGTLLKGGALHLISKEVLKDGLLLLKYIMESKISFLKITPSHLHILLNQDESETYFKNSSDLKLIIVGGEAIHPKDIQYLHDLNSNIQLMNHYGPTEATIGSCAFKINKDQIGEFVSRPVIGFPIANTNFYILADNQNLVPVGVIGEICIAGAGLARGYLNSPTLTDEKFVANPFQTGQRMYKTGDIGRWLADGSIEFLGRKDDQIKIRGYRIELGEIEAVIKKSPLVNNCAVVAQPDALGNKRLIAYIVAEGNYDKLAIQDHLRGQLPDYMIPPLIMELEELPLTPSGKVNKKELPDPDASSLLTNQHVAPRSNLELDLATIWKELLNVQQVGIYDNFFELGGDSIVTIQVVSRAKRMGHQLQARDLFQYQTIATLAEKIEKNTTLISSEQGKLEGVSKLLPIQKEFFNKEFSDLSHFNQSILLEINKEVNEEFLHEVTQALILQHDALRFTYIKAGKNWLQYYGKYEGKLDVVDLSDRDQKDLPHLITESCNKFQRSLDIGKGELIKVVLLKTPDFESNNRLLILVHHLVVDGVSWRILLDDLIASLDTLMLGQPLNLGLKSSSFRSWAEQMEAYAKNPRIEHQQAYWEDIIDSYQPLPVDQKQDGESKLRDVKEFSLNLDKELTSSLLQETNSAYHTEVNDILLAALAQSINKWSGNDQLIVGMESHGREDLFANLDLSSTVGWFTTLYPVRLATGRELSPGNLIKSVKEQLRAIPNKGLGFGLLKYLHPSEEVRNRLSKAKWDLVFNYLGQVDNVLNHKTWFKEARESGGENFSESFSFDRKLEIVCLISEDQLQLSWRYSALDYDEQTIRSLAEQYLAELTKLVQHCTMKETSERTVNDYGLAPWVSFKELDQFLAVEENGIPRKAQISSVFPLSPMQEGMLFHTLFDSESKAYIGQFSVEFGTMLDVEAFEKTWKWLLSKHSILRSKFFHDALSIPVQCVYNEVELPYEQFDYSKYSEIEQEKKYAEYLEKDYALGFTFDGSPLMRIALFKMGSKAYRMIWSNHHILWDGWSASILMAEFVETYESFAQQRIPERQAEDLFEDYLKFIHSRDKFSEKAFWCDYLKDFESPTLLPFVGHRLDRNKGGGILKSSEILLNNPTTAQLKSYVQSNHLTLNTLIQGVWSVLLSTYAGSSSATFGITVSGRPTELPNSEHRVGLYMNTIPLHTKVEAEANLSVWLSNLQEKHTLARENQYNGLNEIQTWIGAQGDFFDSIMVFQNFPVEDVLKQDTLLMADHVESKDQNNYLLSIVVTVSEEVNIKFNYNNLLKEAHIEMMQSHFKYVLEQVVRENIKTIGDIQILGTQEKQQQLETFNAASGTLTLPAPDVVAMFSAQAKRNPENIAVTAESNTLMYWELDELSNKLASHLRNTSGISSNDLVGILLDRSEYWIISILGILKAGAGYVPIDVDYPAERKTFIIEDTNLKVLIIESESLFDVIEYDVDVFSIDLQLEELSDPKGNELAEVSISPDNTAYVIYTSGSTGKPKGVVLTHKNLMASCASRLSYYGEITSMVLISPFVFDSSVAVIWGTLLSSGNLLIPSNKSIKDAALLGKLLQEHKSLDAILCVPSYYKFLLEEQLVVEGTFQRIIVAGESLHRSLVDQHYEITKSAGLYNEYGPTECSVWSTVAKVAQTDEVVTIGHPIDTVQCYVFNEKKQLLPIGVIGELYLGGVQVAPGYLNRPELNEEKFISHQFEDQPESRLYKTGDLVHWLPDGQLEFIGRKDDQVKIRGYRIELGEIEKVLLQSPHVLQAIVMAKEKENGEKYLVGYVVGTDDYQVEISQKHLKTQLPEYMVPSIIEPLEKIPLTPNGKIDKKALLEIETSLHNKMPYVAPKNETEEVLVSIWQQLLNKTTIGVLDDFFDLGGHSLLAIRIVSAIRKELEAEISVVDIFTHPNILALAQFVSSQAKNPSAMMAIEAVERPDLIPASFAQERLWFIDKMEGSSHYHMPAVLRIKGKLDHLALGYAFREIVNRHEVLRTTFIEVEGKTYQQIREKDQWQLDYAESQSETEASWKEQIETQINKPFDLSSDSMLRAQLIQLSIEENILVLVMHHIASDGWSVHLFIHELIELYHAKKENRKSNLIPLSIQYADYAIWQRAHLSEATLSSELQYWEKQLQGLSPINLPLDYTRPAVRTTRGNKIEFSVAKGLSDQLNKLCRAENVTLFMLLLAAFKVLLHRYSGDEDICIGTPSANRTRKEVEPLIGFFINTLALRSNMDSRMSFRDLLHQVKGTTLEAFTHQELPFEKIVEKVEPTRTANQHPIFQVLFALQNNPESKDLNLSDVSISLEDFNYESAKFDLMLDISESEEGIEGVLVYSADLFTPPTIAWMKEHYLTLLSSIVADTSSPINNLPMLRVAENQQLLALFNATQSEYPKTESLIGMFEKQVQKAPEKIALVFGKQTMSYSELDKRANQVAQCLVDKGINAGDRVGILCYRGFEMIISALGILKCRATYVPLNRDYPKKRLEYILQDSAVSYILHNHDELQELTGLLAYKFINVEESMVYPSTGLKFRGTPEDIAYIMYTSGTTGEPKGILVTHQNILKLAFEDKDIAIYPTDRVLQWSNFSFDGSTYDLYSTLLNGASLYLIEAATAADPSRLASIIKENDLTVCFMTTALFNAFVDYDLSAMNQLRKLLFGGELVSTPHVIKALKVMGSQKLIHVYGPTETTVYATYYPISSCELATVPIGYPLSNTSVYVLNDTGDLAGIGVVGEIHIGGDGVSKGYLNQEALTTEKFVANPFDKPEHPILYKTGDLGKMMPDGSIIFIGRKDAQLKMRGYRIELGEIETVLRNYEPISQCVVVAKEDSSGNKQLVAYFVANGHFEKPQLHEYLQGQLPSYMIPSIIMELAELPLTPNGKINKPALPVPDASGMMLKEYVAPSTKTEQVLVSIWNELLDVKEIGIYDNFFEIGGHSLLGMQLMSRVKIMVGVKLSIADLFSYPTIASLAKRIEELPVDQLQRIPKAPESALYELSHAQKRLWILDQLGQQREAFNIPGGYEIIGDLNITCLEKAIETTVTKHEILRTCFVSVKGVPYQKIVPIEEAKVALEVITLTLSENINDEVALLYMQESKHVFSLEQSPLLTIKLVTNGERNFLLVNMHHIISDGWSLQILQSEIMELYYAYKENSATPQSLQIQYKDYAAWQNQLVNADEQKDQKYWINKLRGIEKLPDLPIDKARNRMRSYQIKRLDFELSADQVEQLNKISSHQNVSQFVLLQSLLKAFLSRYLETDDIVIGTPVAGRNHPDLENQIGFYVNMLVLRSQIKKENTFYNLLDTVKQDSLAAFEHQFYPFDLLVDELKVKRDLSRNPLFDIVMKFNEHIHTKEEMEEDLEFIPLSIDETGSIELGKYDLSFDFVKMPTGSLNISIAYNLDLFEEGTIKEMKSMFEEVIEDCLQSPDIALSVLFGPKKKAFFIEDDF